MKRIALVSTLLLGLTSISAAWAQAPVVTGLTLFDAENDEALGPLRDGMVIDLSEVGTDQFSVVAETEGAGSVRFAWNDRTDFQIESIAPFAIAGDSDEGRDLHPWRPGEGEHRLTVTPYPQQSAEGDPGEPVSVSFRVARGTTEDEGPMAEAAAEEEPEDAAAAEADPVDGASESEEAMQGIGRAETDPQQDADEAVEAVLDEAEDDAGRHRFPLVETGGDGSVGSVLVSAYDDHVVLLVSLDRTSDDQRFAATLGEGRCGAADGGGIELEPVTGVIPYAATPVETGLAELRDAVHHVRVRPEADASAGDPWACAELTFDAEAQAR